MTQPEAVFRVHFEDGHKITVTAKSADEARRHAKRFYPDRLVAKAKRLREKS